MFYKFFHAYPDFVHNPVIQHVFFYLFTVALFNLFSTFTELSAVREKDFITLIHLLYFLHSHHTTDSPNRQRFPPSLSLSLSVYHHSSEAIYCSGVKTLEWRGGVGSNDSEAWSMSEVS